jgi:hypothetical protein
VRAVTSLLHLHVRHVYGDGTLDKHRISHDTDPELRIQYLATCTHFDIDGSSPAEYQQQGLHVCTPYAANEDNCITIPNCSLQISVATVTVGSAHVHEILFMTAFDECLKEFCENDEGRRDWFRRAFNCFALNFLIYYRPRVKS